jgi:PAT family beta-lactamase induction signal transducer AmpG
VIGALRVYAHRKMAALAGIGFASGLPYVLVNDTLTAWISAIGVDVRSIGLFSLVTLPYSFKFLWAPAMDRWAALGGRLGRRRGWLLVLQILLGAALLVVAAVGPAQASDPIRPLAVLAVLLALFSASQDIVADAYRADVVDEHELGAGAAVFVSGYRTAMIVGGALSLLLAQHLGWRVALALMGFVMLATPFVTLAAPEPVRAAEAPRSLAAAATLPFVDFVRRHGGRAALVLAFIVLFRLPDLLASRMTMPLLLQHLQFSPQDVGLIRQLVGFAITVVGAIAGGGFVARFGLFRSLLVFGVLQSLSNAGFCVLALQPPSKPLLVGAIALESACGGLVAAGFVAFLMGLCTPKHSATQYALLASLVAVAGSLGGAATGFLVARAGYAAFFGWSIAAGIPGMLLLPWVVRRGG